MNPLEDQLNYLDCPLPGVGDVAEVAPGIGWIRMPLPFALDHINLWCLYEDTPQGPAWTQVDCGIHAPAVTQAWEQVLQGPLASRHLHRVLVTHMHPDHLGLAGWLCQKHQAPLWMSHGDYALGRLLATPGEAPDAGNDADSTIAHFQRHGVNDPQQTEKLGQRKNYFTSLVPSVPRAYRRLQDDEIVTIGGEPWRVIVGRGHSPEHVCLFNVRRHILISGDMVLPRISTNVSVFSIEPEANPLAWFLDSIQQLAQLPADTLVLPSHGRPFHGLHRRIEQLQEHHRDRLQEVWDACQAQACCAADIVPIMFKRPLDTHQLTFALGEALSHLHLMWYEGRLQRHLDADGVYRFSPA